MSLGQKIKVSQQICSVLKKMRCPEQIQPFQLQGMDLKNILLVFKWLIKFVYQTRQQRKKYNFQISHFLTTRFLKAKEKFLNLEQLKKEERRLTKNSDIKKVSRKNPLRVYSAMIQFGDLTSKRTYNKLLQIVYKQSKINQVQAKNKQQQNSHLITSMNKQQQIHSFINKHQIDMHQMLFQQSNQSQEIKINFSQLKRKNSFASQHLEVLFNKNLEQIQESLQIAQENLSPQIQEAKIHIARMDNLNNSLKHVKNQQQQIKNQLEQKQQQNQQLDKKISNIKEQIQEFQNFQNELQKQLAVKNLNKINNLNQMVDKRNQLKNYKKGFKKIFVDKANKLQSELQIVKEQIPEINEEVFQEMQNNYNAKKKVYDLRFKELTQLNQEVALLQRKTQSYPNSIQIAQYHQRFLQLFESINGQIQRKRGNVYINRFIFRNQQLTQYEINGEKFH